MAERGLRGMTALVTGGARRIGKAIGIALAGEGVNIVVHSLVTEDAEGMCAEIEKLGARAWWLNAEFTNPEEYRSVIPKALEAAGSLDVLVNSASIFPPGTLMDMELEDLVKNLQVNAWVPFLLSREFYRRVGKGKIINLLDSRLSGYDWGHVPYILSKHIFAILTKMTALSFAPGMTVNGISPGLILPPAGKDEAYMDRLVNKVPLRRHGSPGDIASAVIYLLRNDFLTGEVIYVDGGRHLSEYGDGSYSN